MFVCSGNSCRSQIAEGFARASGVEAYSAGTDPAGYVHPLAVRVMAEEGIDISRHTSKRLDLNLAQTMDAVVTVCGEADQTCPVISHVNRVHWPIPDPAKATGTQEEILSVFRAVRDDIARRVNEFLEGRTANRGSK
ncbi:MAG: arsenate reductase ArsC [Deltaproteobacteria bacterium]|nr:arsenate reductase ArsC [Deltaproteobacteria bacterium]